MSRSWPVSGRLAYAKRLIEEGVPCKVCGEHYLPSGLPGHLLNKHGAKQQPKPKQRSSTRFTSFWWW